ncbi:hypothetical protein RCM07_10015 [Escherichia coli]|uniref:hypothetical protein n=1 Tax=Escherichia coli TaxID=562 RepID=UPI000B8028EE|nr:hypothetical protein [Escherichia coli]EEZ9001633.1 hypothetical protein [Escherichia coli]EFA4902753.1 hypothetical protein [Escherichia coli]EFM4136909.1 hypothetical protein [Escherichia coli]EFN5178409.1 hypothetical protein [Escherichia coli]EHC2687537.1 hypothetical protein [Escherichia coli]
MSVHHKAKKTIRKKTPLKKLGAIYNGSELIDKYPKALSSSGALVFLTLLENGRLTDKGVERKVNKLKFKEQVISLHPELLETKSGKRFVVSAIRTSATPSEFERKVKKLESQKVKFDKMINESVKENRIYHPVMAGKK